MSKPPLIADEEDRLGETPEGALPPPKSRNAQRKLKNFKLKDDRRIVGAYSIEDVERAFGPAFEISSRGKVRAARAVGYYVDLSDPGQPKAEPARAPNRVDADRSRRAKEDPSTGDSHIKRVVEEAERRIISIVAEFERRLLPLAGGYSEGHSSDHLAARSRSLGAEPGRKMAPVEARAVLARIAEDANDVFNSSDRALTYLESADIDGYGASAQSLIEMGRTTSVLARLDVIRFGSQG